MSVPYKNLQRVDVIFAVSIVFFLILIFQIAKSAREVSEGRDLENRTYVIMNKLEALLAHTIDIETGDRGYALSGKEEFLEPLKNGKEAVSITLDSLRLLILDPEQKRRLDTLHDLIDEKLIISENAVQLRRTDGMQPAVDYISQGEGKRVMDSIRRVVSRAGKRELVLLSERTTATNDKRTAREIYFIILFFVVFFCIIASYVIIRRRTRSLLDNKQVQEELIQELTYQNTQLDDFAHLASHNIRGPAKNIGALVSMVNADSPVSEFQLIFGKIEKVSKNLMETLNELLEILHVKKNRAMERTEVSFQQVFAKEKESMEGEILKTNAQLLADFRSVPTVEYPKTYLESICHNLISNALKYRSPDRAPVVQIRSEQKNGYTYLHVSDNGLGIDLERYGDKLFGLRKTFHEHPEARGIGLFMTKAQIEALGGKITVQSKVGEGTVFSIRF